MINNDRKLEKEEKLIINEYLASFWNPEAVKKIHQNREDSAKHAFKDDKEFEKEVVSGDYKNNPYLEAIKKIRASEYTAPIQKNSKTKLPTDLSSIKNTLGKF